MRIINPTILKRTISAFLVVAILFLSFYPVSKARAGFPKECCYDSSDMKQLVNDVVTEIGQKALNEVFQLVVGALLEIPALNSCNSHTGNGLTLENFPTLCLPDKVANMLLGLFPEPGNHNDDVWNKSRKGLEIKYPSYCEMSIPGYEIKKYSDQTEEDCYKLKKIYDLSFIEAVAAKKLVDYTDPLDKGNPLKSCKSHCYISITDRVLYVLFWELCLYVYTGTGNTAVDKIIKVVRSIQKIQEMVEKLQKLKDNINALASLAQGVQKAIQDIRSINIEDITNIPNLKNLKNSIKELATSSSSARKSLEKAKTKITSLEQSIDNSPGPTISQDYSESLKEFSDKTKDLNDSIEKAPNFPDYISSSNLYTYVTSLENTLNNNSTSSNAVNILNRISSDYSQYLTDSTNASATAPQGNSPNNNGETENNPMAIAKQKAESIIQDINNYVSDLTDLKQELERIRSDVIPNISTSTQYAYEMVTLAGYEIPDMINAFGDVLSKAKAVDDIEIPAITEEQKQQINDFYAEASTTKAALENMVKTINTDEQKLKQVSGITKGEETTINQVIGDLQNIKNNLNNNLEPKLINTFNIDEGQVSDTDQAIQDAINKINALKTNSQKVQQDLGTINTLSQLPGKIKDIINNLKPTVEAIKNGSLSSILSNPLNSSNNNQSSNSSNGGSNSSNGGSNSSNGGSNSNTQTISDNQAEQGLMQSNGIGFKDLKDNPRACTGYGKSFNLFPSLSVIPEIMSSAFQIQILTSEMQGSFKLRGQAETLRTYSLVLYILSDILKRNAEQVKCGDPTIHQIPLCISKAPFCLDPYLDSHYWMVIALRTVINSYADKILHIIKNGCA